MIFISLARFQTDRPGRSGSAFFVRVLGKDQLFCLIEPNMTETNHFAILKCLVSVCYS
jgi:hypothetical protein